MLSTYCTRYHERDVEITVVGDLAAEDNLGWTARSWAVVVVPAVHARDAAASCRGTVALLCLEGLENVRSESGGGIDLESSVLDESDLLLVIWVEEADELALVLALATVGLATTSFGDFLRLAPVGGAGVAARSLADRAFGALVTAEPAPEVVVRYRNVWAGRVVVGGIGVV
jgi:hypothetical protein